MAQLVRFAAGALIAAATVFVGVAPLAGQTARDALRAERPTTAAGCPLEIPADFYRCALEKAKAFEPARTADGQPDFRGTWEVQTGYLGYRTYTLEGKVGDDPTFKILNGKTGMYPSVVVDPADGNIPYHPWAARKVKEYYDNHNDPTKLEHVDGRSRCFLPGVPRQILFGGPHIIQTREAVVLLNEFNHIYRVVPLDGRAHIPPGMKLWMGDSVGRWEGKTLVVDTTNQSGATAGEGKVYKTGKWLDMVGNIASDDLHVRERWTMVDPNTILYTATLDDPTVYTRPWTTAFAVMRNNQANYEMYESACYEGDHTAWRAHLK